MIVKLLIFICSVYVVKAYVVINVFDDEVETNNSLVGKGVSDCIPRGCWQLCHGVCVNGVCKCDQILQQEDADSQVTSRMDLGQSPVISECSPLGCAQLCRRIGLKGGVCVHGKCKCDLFIESEVSDTDDTQTSLTRCNSSRCYRGCRSIGYPGGHCVGFECRCDPRSESNLVENVDDDTRTPLRKSNRSQCFRGCRFYGDVGEIYWGDRCLCIPRSSQAEDSNLFENLDGDVQADTQKPLEKCHTSECYLKCRGFGFKGGFCIGKRCICLPGSTKSEDSNLIISSDGDVQEMKLENPSPMLTECNIAACEQLCRRIFLKGGSCVNGKCKCDIIMDTKESNEIPMTKKEDKDEETAMDDDQKSLVETCYTSQCNQMCRGIGFNGGRCDYRDACRCY